MGHFIGIINWFNNEKGFGTLWTNQLCHKEANRDESCKRVELFVHINDCVQSDIFFNGGDWVEFSSTSVRKEKLGEKARRVRPLGCGVKTLRAGLRYRGEFAKILWSETSRHGNTSVHKEVVLEKVVQRVLAQNGAEEVRRIFAEVLSFLPAVGREGVIDDILGATRDLTLLRKSYFPFERYEVGAEDSVTLLMQKKVGEKVIQGMGLADIAEMPVWFDFTSYGEALCRKLREELDDKVALGVAHVLGKEMLVAMFPDPKGQEVSYAARLALANVLDDGRWIREFEPTSWDDFVAWLNKCGDDVRVWFIWNYFWNREDEFFVAHSLEKIFDKGIFEKCRDEFVEDSKLVEGRRGLFKQLISYCLKVDFAQLGKLLDVQGVGEEMVVEAIVQSLNESAARGDGQVREIVERLKVAENFRVIAESKGLNDEALIVCFCETGDVEFLNQVRDLAGAIRKVSQQDDGVVCKFVKSYLGIDGLEVGEDDPVLVGIGEEKLAAVIKFLPKEERYLFVDR